MAGRARELIRERVEGTILAGELSRCDSLIGCSDDELIDLRRGPLAVRVPGFLVAHDSHMHGE